MRKHSIWIGDLVVWFLITLIGFASHGELQMTAIPRLAATFFPLIIAWFPLAFSNGLLEPPSSSLPFFYLLKLILTTISAVAVAILVRAAWLNSSALPLFALVMMLFATAGILLWRFAHFALFRAR
ncbi:MAG: DUF3054 domain-containing protein [Anaerolineales bacterium]